MSTSKRIAVAGATGRVGRHVVDVLREGGHDVVPMSRATGVDLATGAGLADALVGVEGIVDVASWPTPDEAQATAYFETATRTLQAAGQRAGVRRLVVVSIIGIERVRSGYNKAKLVHEQVALAGPVPVRVLRAAQFHEFVEPLVQWSTQGDVAYLPPMRTQLVAARTVAEQLAALAVDEDAWDAAPAAAPFAEIAGPREESLPEAARLLVARRGGPARIEEVRDAAFGLDAEAFANGALLPGANARLAGPTFAEWLEGADRG